MQLPLPTSESNPFSADISTLYAQVLAHCFASGVAVHDDAGVADHVQRVLLASDFAADSFSRDPTLLGATGLALMVNSHSADTRTLLLDGSDEAGAMRALRVYRRREAVRLIWRDVNALDTLEQTLAGATALAETCIQAALMWAEAALALRFGTPRNDVGAAQRLVVIGMGKLGGGDLNFSSDIDIILAFADHGVTDGVRAIANETFFARVGQALMKLLAEITADGYVYRVDLRLRPFGSAGRVALSLGAMEHYYQREGRDWERYAWIKARAVAGDLVVGKRLIEAMRPFVYRRYLDYTAFAGLREMKALIDAEVARKELAENLKLGAGGIREIEFIVQLVQLIRGGREPGLRERGLLASLAACEQLGFIEAANARTLREAYCLLRHVENRIQMMRDEQSHELPSGNLRRRIAKALGYHSEADIDAELVRVRCNVSAIFADVMAPIENIAPHETLVVAYYAQVKAGTAVAEQLIALGYGDGLALHLKLAGLLASGNVRAMSPRGRMRLDTLLPALLDEVRATSAPDICLDRMLRLLHNIARRSAYLALLEEQPLARRRLVALFADTALLAERVIAHPLLLDDLLDVRVDVAAPDRRALLAQTQRRLTTVGEAETEARIVVLQEEKNSVSFRVGLGFRSAQLDSVATARGLSVAADFIVTEILAMATREAHRQNGKLTGFAGEIDEGLAVIGYGSLGGAELGFASDLDLVFVYNDSFAQCESDGARPLDGARYYARIAQRIVNWLGSQTPAGKLYEVDVRLRPDGSKGLLVVSSHAFADYQRERAWVWEHQALVRARPIAGGAVTLAAFSAVRNATLSQPREARVVIEAVCAMRARWRAERDRSTPQLLDLKQGVGALLDIEFLLQALVLTHAHRKPRLLASGNTATLIALARQAQLLDANQARALADAHAVFLNRALACTLDARSRLVPRDAQIAAHVHAVVQTAAAIGLNF